MFAFPVALFFAGVLLWQIAPGYLNPIWLMIGLYFLPAIVAIMRRRSPMAVTFLNTTLGWTGVGWFVSMVWALA
jgi:hypothetical protein